MERYQLHTFKALVEAERWFYLNERRISRFLDRLRDELGWEDEQVKEILLGLSPKDFQKISSNCKIEDFPGRERVDADQYEIHWDIDEKVGKPAPTRNTLSISLKIIIDEDVDGPFAGLVTFHGSGSP